MKHAVAVVPIILLGVFAGFAHGESISVNFYADYHKLATNPIIESIVPTPPDPFLLRFGVEAADLDGGFIDIEAKSHIADYPIADYPEEYGTDGEPLDTLIRLVGNGIPDSQFELGLVQFALANESLEISGGVSHAAVVTAWHNNDAVLGSCIGSYYSIFKAAAPELVEILEGFCLVGDGWFTMYASDHITVVTNLDDAMIFDFIGGGGFISAFLTLLANAGMAQHPELATIDHYTRFPSVFGKDGDADGDCCSNWYEYSDGGHGHGPDFRPLPTDSAATIASKGMAYVAVALDPTQSSCSESCGNYNMLLDSDHDNLPDHVEEVIGTNPFNADTDGGGVMDGIEYSLGLNPLDISDDAGVPVANAFSAAILIALTAALGLRKLQKA